MRRRTGTVLVLGALLLALPGGVASAADIRCDGNPCTGTEGYDRIVGRARCCLRPRRLRQRHWQCRERRAGRATCEKVIMDGGGARAGGDARAQAEQAFRETYHPGE